MPDSDPVSPAHIKDWRSRIPRIRDPIGKVRDDTLFGQPHNLQSACCRQDSDEAEVGLWGRRIVSCHGTHPCAPKVSLRDLLSRCPLRWMGGIDPK
ncbi:hypothetical protein [Rhodohalobacter sp. 8-1]|uniref:hypothetical protein n=1 Tax=Rhodohalobacter sp. 8-1 TaxID=3131972 RepID=UPI0030EEBA3B